MSANELNAKIKELRELRRMSDEISAEIEAITDSIKKVMTERKVDELNGNDWKITWKAVVSSRVDTTALKKELPEIAAQYTKTSTSKRFLIA